MNWRKLLKPLFVVGLVFTVMGVLMETPLRQVFLDTFKSANDFVQIAILSMAGAAIMGLGAWTVFDKIRIKKIEDERDDWKRKVQEYEKEEQKKQQLAEKLWTQPPNVKRQRYLGQDERAAKFVCVLNFKGGVGKTTLTANLGATMAMMEPPNGKRKLRVLVVDLDFQHSLSDICVETKTLDTQFQKSESVANLLTDPRPELIEHIAVRMHKVEGADVAVSDERLRPAEQMNDALMLLRREHDETEVRYLFQSVFHTTKSKYDLVLFDCRPELTGTVVNALACSDWVLIPTSLDRTEIDAVPRTVEWVKRMANRGVIRLPGICVVLNRVKFFRGKPLKRLAARLDRLKQQVGENCVLTNGIGTIGSADKERGTVPAFYSKVRNMFLPLADELRKKVGI